jgi:hypothetical protein
MNWTKKNKRYGNEERKEERGGKEGMKVGNKNQQKKEDISIFKIASAYLIPRS